MKELPILMGTPMVKATMEGTKTQTRRIIKNPNLLSYPKDIENIKGTNLWTDGTGEIVKCPYGTVGDILWVRETFAIWNNEILYKADYPSIDEAGLKPVCGWKPSIFMKREHSRISLLVKNVRIERLQDITESDAIAEGILTEIDNLNTWYYDYMQKEFNTLHPCISYRTLWASINGWKSWEDNPLVWVVEIEKM
jgi:hypothetical protein